MCFLFCIIILVNFNNFGGFMDDLRSFCTAQDNIILVPNRANNTLVVWYIRNNTLLTLLTDGGITSLDLVEKYISELINVRSRGESISLLETANWATLPTVTKESLRIIDNEFDLQNLLIISVALRKNSPVCVQDCILVLELDKKEIMILATSDYIDIRIFKSKKSAKKYAKSYVADIGMRTAVEEFISIL